MAIRLTIVAKILIVTIIITSAAVAAALILMESSRPLCADTTQSKVQITAGIISYSPLIWEFPVYSISPFYSCHPLDVNKLSFSVTNQSGDLMAEWPAPVKFDTNWNYKPRMCLSPLTACSFSDANRNSTLDVGDYMDIEFRNGTGGTNWMWKASVYYDGSGVFSVDF